MCGSVHQRDMYTEGRDSVTFIEIRQNVRIAEEIFLQNVNFFAFCFVGFLIVFTSYINL